MFQRFNCSRSSLLLLLGLLSSSTFAAVDSSDAGKEWKSRKTRTVRPAKTPDERNQYGGWASHQVAEPGFFRTMQRGKKWWLVDPDGCLFLSIGVNSVQAKRIGVSDEKQWGKDTYELLNQSGFNTIGRWSSPNIFKAADKQIPWCSTLGFIKDYAKQRPSSRGETGYPKETLPVFDEEWPAFCDAYAARQATRFADDKYLLGHFSDNEIPFRPNALRLYLSLPAKDAGHKAALAWMKENRVGKGKIDDPEVQAKFLQLVAEKYYDTVAAALKKADPNHLYIGSRIHGRCISEPVLRGSDVCDIISVNYYHAWEPEKKKTAEWTKWSNKPFLVGEFYAMKIPNKRTNEPDEGAGFRVLKYEEAGEFYHTYTAALLKNHPNCVGWHWFKYADATEDYQKGIVGTKGEVHQPLVDAMKVLNDQAYSIRRAR